MAIGIVYAMHVHWLSASISSITFFPSAILKMSPQSATIVRTVTISAIQASGWLLSSCNLSTGGGHTYVHATCMLHKLSKKPDESKNTRQVGPFLPFLFPYYPFFPSSGAHARTFRLFCFLLRLWGALLASSLTGTAKNSANNWPGLQHWIYLYEVRSIKSRKSRVFDLTLV